MAALFIDDGLGVGHVVSEPLAMLARHEHVVQAVKDAGRNTNLGHVEAPRLDQTEDVVDITPAPRLRAVAVNRDRHAAKRLGDEV